MLLRNDILELNDSQGLRFISLKRLDFVSEGNLEEDQIILQP